MNDSKGVHTEDLRQIRPAELPDDEARTQRFGRRALIGGLSLCGATVLGTLIAWILADNLFPDADAALFGVLIFTSGIATGTSLAVIGGIEHQGRPIRARQRLGLVEYQRMCSRLDGLIADTHERFEVVMGLLAPVAGRLDRFAERVDTGGKEYLERLARVEATTAAVAEQLGIIAEHLPDAMLSEHWKGFNEAVREGFAQQTGTDGAARRRPGHLGLAPGTKNER